MSALMIKNSTFYFELNLKLNANTLTLIDASNMT